MRQLSFKQYRAMDLAFLTALLCLCEALIILGATRWFPEQPYVLSLTGTVTAIVMIRWGLWSVIPAEAGALVLCLVSGANAGQFGIYCAGNLLCLALLPLIRRLGWEWVRANGGRAVCHGIGVVLLMQLGRALTALALGNTLTACLQYFTTDILSVLFAAVVLWIAQRVDGLLEDQRHYIRRIQQENTKGMNS